MANLLYMLWHRLARVRPRAKSSRYEITFSRGFNLPPFDILELWTLRARYMLTVCVSP
jgi:hypothetical protein